MSVSRPNILIVITHDTGRRLGCYGASVRTPHLDRLAEHELWLQLGGDASIGRGLVTCRFSGGGRS